MPVKNEGKKNKIFSDKQKPSYFNDQNFLKELLKQVLRQEENNPTWRILDTRK